MPLMIHTLSRTALPENGLVTFELGGTHYVVADLEGDVRAFAVAGPAVARLGRAAVAEGRLRCPLHGWPIDSELGACGAAELCRYAPLPVEVEGDTIRVGVSGP
jgi:nitrite reductase/ring-hydroxylating ferredoxin subunit